jgi:hypothetical protein
MDLRICAWLANLYSFPPPLRAHLGSYRVGAQARDAPEGRGQLSLSCSINQWLTSASTSLRRFANKSLAAWVSIAVLLVLATAQPNAYALDFPMTSHISLPDEENISVAPAPTPTMVTVALYTQMQTTSLVSSNELAMVALQSQQIEMARTITGAQSVARLIMLAKYKWGMSQFGCLKTLWAHESHWNYKAHNYSSGAHGIAQALPADKMSMIAPDWRTNPVTQIRWGLHYIDVRYSTPCKALQTFNWRGSY